MGNVYTQEMQEAVDEIIKTNRSLKEKIKIQGNEIENLKRRIQKLESLYERKSDGDQSLFFY